MELMTSCVDKLQKRRGHAPVPEQMLGYICVSVVKALKYLKDTHNVMHRDVKPSNILLDRNGKFPDTLFGKMSIYLMAASRKAGHGRLLRRELWTDWITCAVQTTGNVKLCDFGIAGHLVESKAKSENAGVAGYTAPERIDPSRFGKKYDVRADVWSLGEGEWQSSRMGRLSRNHPWISEW